MTTLSDRLPDGHIILDTAVTLPPVLDLLIVGGGPVGTACAFRAKELGIAALVIEMDDLMKRIRDYAKEKPILPDYGGGDTMQFPAGGDLVERAALRPDRQRSHGRALEGAVSQAQRAGAGGRRAAPDRATARRRLAAGRRGITTRKQNQLSFLAKNIVLGLGRGVPRRLDIPGNVQDLANRC